MAKRFQIELTKPEVEEIHMIVDTEIFEYMIEQDQDESLLVSIKNKMASFLKVNLMTKTVSPRNRDNLIKNPLSLNV